MAVENLSHGTELMIKFPRLHQASRPMPPLHLSASVETIPAVTATGTFGPLCVAGLFAGIGGIELGLSRAGHQIVYLCEKDSSARLVLGKRFPGISVAEDVTRLKHLPT